MTYQLRTANPADFELVFALNKANMRQIVEVLRGWNEEEERTDMRRFFAPGLDSIIVVDGQDVGHLKVEEEAARTHLRMIALSPDRQRQGVGTEIIGELIRASHARCVPLTLWVSALNHRAIRLYQRLGFIALRSVDFGPKGVKIEMVARPPVSGGRASHGRNLTSKLTAERPYTESSMTTPVELPLHEQLLLLSLHDEKGTVHTSMFSYAIAGAIIAELLDTRRLRIEQDGRHAVLVVANPSSTADPLLDECVQRIARAVKPATVSTWVTRFAAIKELKDRIAERLCHRGILTRSEDRVWWVIPRVVYPTADRGPEERIVTALWEAIDSERDIDARTAIVVALSYSAGILGHVFDRSLLKARAERIDAMVSMADVRAPTKDAIEGARAAVAILAGATTVTASRG